ncbi:putative reverse transcriptase domain, reverse transcriptase zinc-binding domain protein [Tanacetum coccineum]
MAWSVCPCFPLDALFGREVYETKSQKLIGKGRRSNSAYFHKAVKSRVSRSRIDAVTDANGVVFQNEKVADAFISHYEAWDTVGSDVNYVVREFFVNGRLLKEINHTIIALILKVKAPARIMHNYHLDRGVARCAFKVDIQKAYDTVDWAFLRGLVFMIGWGLRQGDPLSPYLFTLVMEVLMLMLQRRVRDSNQFTYHRYCSKLDLINLCFADDLFLFAHGDVNSVMVIKEALDEFKCASSLIPSLPKSTTYFCNVLNFTKLAVL